MTERERTDKHRENDRDAVRERTEHDDPTRETDRQIDDNQDDMGRDVNDPDEVANDINRTGH